MQGGRDSHGRHAALQHAFGQFLDKQWHAIGAIDDLIDDVIGQRVAAGNLRYQSAPIAPVQAIEGQHCHQWLAGRGRLELGSEGHDQQHRQVADALNSEVEQFARSRIKPMRVFEDHRGRLLVRQTLELADQRFQCLFLFALRTEVGQWVWCEAGNDSRSAMKATSSLGGVARADRASSFSNLAAGGSSCANPLPGRSGR